MSRRQSSPRSAEEPKQAQAPEIVEDELDLESPSDEDEDKAVTVDVSGEGDVIDVGSEAMVKRRSVTLADETGEWIPEEAPRPSPEEAGRIDDLYRAFVRQATQYPRLSEEQERALGLRVRDHGDGDAARRLVLHNLRLAIKMAHQYRRSWTNIMDLVQEASAGMAIAAERWDPDQGTRFGTYAVYWIRAQLTKFLMTNGRVIHTGNTRAGRKLYFQLPKIRRRLLAEGKEPSIANIAKEVDEDEAEVARVISRLDGREASLSAPIGSDSEGGVLEDLIESDDVGPEAHANENEANRLIKSLVDGFAATIEDERDRSIWFEHLVSSDPTSLVELGKRYGVSKQRMGQLATRLKRGFRRHVIDELGPNTKLSWLFSQD